MFLAVSAVFDALITVPVFMKPNEVSHFEFFTDLEFLGIAMVFISVVVLYYRLKVRKQFVNFNK